MRIVLDANIVIAALLGSETALKIIISQKHQFYAPHKIIDEIKKYKQYICGKAGQTAEEFHINFEALLIFIKVLDYAEYEAYTEKAKAAIAERDWNDTDYIACALAASADFIWSNDKDFTSQKLIPIKTTEQLVKEMD